MPTLTKLPDGPNTTKTSNLDCRMPRVTLCLFLALFPLLLFAAGHDVSSVRYAPPGLSIGPTKIAANGSRFLTVWSMSNVYPKPNLAYGVVTDAAYGQSSTPFLLPGITGSPTAMTSWGGGFISLWWSYDHFDIVTLLANGAVERVSRVPRIAGKPRFATNGRQLLVADLSSDQLFSGYESVSASLYDADGTLLARTALPVIGVTNFDVARAGNSYVVITSGFGGGVHFFRLDDAGTIIADKELQGRQFYALRESLVAVAGDAAHAVVAWTATDLTPAYATSISNSNDVGALQPLPMKYAFPAIRVVPAASGFLILWSEDGHVSLVRTNAAGQIIDMQAIPSGYLENAAAADDQFAFITRSESAWYDPLAIITGTVTPQGLRMSSSPMVTSTAARQEQPLIVSDGVDYVSTWLEHDGPDVIAKIGRVTRAGVPLDGPGVTLPAPTKKVRNVSIARGAGGDALVVVSAAEGAWAFRWSRIVGLVDTSPIILDGDGANFGTAVAWNGVSYLVVGARFYTSSSLAGWFVGSDGSASKEFAIPMTLDNRELAGALNPAIVWDGRQFLISIPTGYNGLCNTLCPSPAASEIRLVRLSANGLLLDRTPYRILNKDSARIATSGSEFLVVTSGFYSSLSAVIVKTQASGLSVGAPVMNIDDGLAGDVTWDGASYDVAWRGFGPWLRLWRFDRDGHVLQKQFATATTSDTPSAAANAAGEVAIGFSEQAPPSGVSRARIYFDSELQQVPPIPATPTNASAHLINYYTLVRWDGDAPGFIVERFSEVTGWHTLQQVSGDVHEALIYAFVGDTIRVRAFGPDGITPNGAITTVRSEPRTHSVRR
jgi:hypothetical protein